MAAALSQSNQSTALDSGLKYMTTSWSKLAKHHQEIYTTNLQFTEHQDHSWQICKTKKGTCAKVLAVWCASKQTFQKKLISDISSVWKKLTCWWKCAKFDSQCNTNVIYKKDISSENETATEENRMAQELLN